MTDQIFRCSDRHLFSANFVKLIFLSVHFGASKFLRCPVDHKWRMADRIDPQSLSETELDEAKRNRF